ncbi:MAG: cupin domain-containing protein [Candidatus Eremiobacter antarcticus]
MKRSTMLACALADGQRAELTVTRRSARMFSHGTMEVKYYRPEFVDRQTPHSQDEVYVVIAGLGIFECDGERVPFEPGAVLFAAAGAEHRFTEFSEDFSTWVVFYGPEGGEHP